MTSDGGNDSEALTGGDLTKNRALVALVSNLSKDRPDLKFPSMQAWCAMANPTVRDSEHVKRIGRHLAALPRAKCWFRWQRSGDLEAYSDADWRGDPATRYQEAGTVWRCGRKSSRWCLCPAPRASCTRRPKLRHKGWGYRVWRRTWEKSAS